MRPTLYAIFRRTLARIVLALAVAMAFSARASATAPISGNTLDFGAVANAGTHPEDLLAVALGDLDNDGDLDAVSADAAGVVAAWQNAGTPFAATWISNTIGTAPASVASLALGDLDNDGYLDVASGGDVDSDFGDREIIVWQNNHSPFGGAWPTSQDVGDTAVDVRSIGLGDWDLDGDLDLVSADSSANIWVWENTATRFSFLWTPNVVGIAENGVRSVAVGDMDNDGRADVVSGGDTTVGNYSLYVWLNSDDTPFSGTWGLVNVGDSTTRVSSVALGDLDGDGDQDIVTARQGGAIHAWQNPFSPGAALPDDWASNQVGGFTVPARSVAVGDLDGDSNLDVVGTANSDAVIEVLAWQNDSPFSGGWTPTDVGATTDNVHAAALGDLDGDGDLDAVVVAGTLAIAELMAVPNTHAHRNAVFTNGGVDAGSTGTAPIQSIAAGDLDGDGDPDIITGSTNATNELIAWENDGSPFSGGQWAQHEVGALLGGSVASLALGDLDNDGDLDLAIGASSDDDFEVSIWHNDGTPFDGVWVQQDVGSPNDSYVHAVALGDLDNDGDLDIVSASGDFNMELMAWENDGGTWTGSDLGNAAQISYALALGDLDNDGYLDVVSGSYNPVNAVTAWRNDGSPFDGAWGTSGTVGTATLSVLGLALGHLDGDGYLDVVSGSDVGAGQEVVAWGNDGTPFDGGWAEGGVGDSEGGVNDAALGDLDGDGDLDIVTGANGNSAEEIVAWLNDGTPYDGGWGRHNVGESTWVNAVALSDLDADGDLDIASGSNHQEDFEFIVWQNTGGSAGLAASPAAPAAIGPDTESPLLQVDFSHNGISGDGDLELDTFNLTFTRDDCATPLTTTEATNLFDILWVRLDDGDGVFETSDTIVTGVVPLSLAAGVQEVPFPDGSAHARISVGETATYWISLVTTEDAPGQDPNSVCVLFDPDADALVQAKGSDYSISIQDTGATSTGGVDVAYLVYAPLVIRD